MSLLTLSVPRSRLRITASEMFVWDLQTGVITNNIKHRNFGKLAFSGNRGTITILEDCGDFVTYNALHHAQLYQGSFVSSQSYGLGAHWINEDTLRIATSSKTNGVSVIEIRELRPTSTPPFHLIASFPAPPHDRKSGFSFSSVSYHASFATRMEVVILDVRNSRALLRFQVGRARLSPPGRFSPDGRFFACAMSGREIRVWQNTPTGYVPCGNLQSRLPFEEFSFSPTTPSILTWGPEGIQLLCPDDRLSPPESPGSSGLDHRRRDHLVAYSADHAYIATARQEDGIITVLDHLSGTLRRSINTSMRIQEIGAVDDAIFVVSESSFAWWDPQTGGRVHGARGAQEVVNDVAMVIDLHAENLASSNDCSQIAFSLRGTVFVYDVNVQKIIAQYKPRHDMHGILDIRFSLDMNCLRLFTRRWASDRPSFFRGRREYLLEELEIMDNGDFGDVTCKLLDNSWSWVDLFSRGCRIWSGSGQWVVDPRGSKLLWLPPSWRVTGWNDVRWDGDFLALLDGRHELPIIIEFCP